MSGYGRKRGDRLYRFLLLLSAVLAVGCCAICLAGAEQVSSEIRTERTVRENDREILIRWPGEVPETLQANVFSAGESIMEQAVLENGILILRLQRPVREGELVQAVIAGNGNVSAELEITAQQALNASLDAIDARILRMTEAWQEEYLPSLRKGFFYLPSFWTDLPFTFYPDEAPKIGVTEDAGGVRIHLDGALPDGWQIDLGIGMPVEKTPCHYDSQNGCWVGSGTFDAVYLTRDKTDDNWEIVIAYNGQNGYAAEYPVLSYVDESDAETAAFACYGWGTARNYQGSMYALVYNEQSYYAEYGLDHYLKNYTDGATGCVYEIYGKLMEGEEPEGFVNPVIHTLER